MAIFGKKDEAVVAAKPAAKKTASKAAPAKKTATAKAPAAASMQDLYSEGGKKADGKSETKRKYDQAYRWIVKPLVTEKATVLNTLNQYVFAVAKEANKIEVAKAIESIYGVKPVAVNMLRVSGKNVRFGRTKGKRKDWKKAVVTLPAGKSIKVYEGV